MFGSTKWPKNAEKKLGPDDVPKYLELKRWHSEVITELCHLSQIESKVK